MHRPMLQRSILHNAPQPQQRILRNSSFLTTLQRNVLHATSATMRIAAFHFVKPDSELVSMHALLRAQLLLEPLAQWALEPRA